MGRAATSSVHDAEIGPTIPPFSGEAGRPLPAQARRSTSR
jgi:hypothetical protein